MKKTLSIIISVLFFSHVLCGLTPNEKIVTNVYSVYFNNAYALYPDIPKGTLEAVAFTNTRFTHLGSNEAESCAGMPRAYGVMGLILDGKNYFSDNLKLISTLSGYSQNEIINSPEKNILAYAKSFHLLLNNITERQNRDKITLMADVLLQLSELPNKTMGQNFALHTQLYGVFSFMNDAHQQALYKFPNHDLDLKTYFGEENFKVLSGSQVNISQAKVSDKEGNTYKNIASSTSQSSDYGPALWAAASSCNYSGGRSQSVSAVTIHFVQGTYAGCISWFQNCSAGVSAHYVVRSSDGQITQMVSESNTAWHVGSENPYTIGIEHEGYVNDISWFTNAMYNSSGALSKDICNSGYGINPKSTGFWPWLNTTYYDVSVIPGSCTKIKGHMHYPNQSHTDPGPNWDWDYYYKIINNPMPVATLYTGASGNLFDSGGAALNYSNDERLVWTIAPPGATNVTLTFNNFNTEDTWDYIYVYDGPSVWYPLIGYYTGSTNPGTLIASSGTMSIEFRSDCAVTAPGWNAAWQSNVVTNTPANLAINTAVCPHNSVTFNWTNSGSAWVVDVSAVPTFTSYYSKAAPNLTTMVCPGGFANNINSLDYLAFEPNTTYYWRLWDGSGYTYGNSFMTPSCVYQYQNCSGTFNDTGGPGNPYTGNEDYVTVIQPNNASSVSLSFSSFNTEINGDSLWIYNGPNTNAPLLGIYSGTISPGTVVANSGAMAIRFRSDPYVNNAGWTATWNCALVTGLNEGAIKDASFKIYPNPSQGIFNFVFANDLKNPHMEIYNALGQKVGMVAGGIGSSIQVDLSSQANGIYFIHFKSVSGTTMQKLIINR